MATSKSSKKPSKAAISAAKAKSTVKKGAWKWMALATVSLATFIAFVYTSMLTASIGTVISEFDTNVSGVVGVIASYSVIAAAFAVLSSKLGEVFGKRRVLLLGLLVFAVGALVAASASDLFMLTIGWSVLMGIGSALVVTQSLSVVQSSYSGKEQTRASGILGAVAVSGLALGPVIGAYVLDSLEFAWVFRIAAIAAVVAFVLSYLLKADGPSKKVKFDVNALWLHGLGQIAVVLGILLSAKYGLVRPRQALAVGDVEIAPFSLSISVLLIGLGLVFLFLASRKTSISKSALLKNRQFNAELVTLTIQSLLLTGVLIGTALFLQVSLDLNAVDTGIALLPLSASAVLVSFLALSLAKRFLPRTIVGTGFLVSAVGLVLVDTVVQTGMASADLIPGLIVLGVGLGLLASQTQNVFSTAPGLSTSAQQFGNALGTAVFGTFIVIGLTYGLGNALEEQAIYDAQSRDLLSSTVKEDVNKLNDDELDALLSSVPPDVIEQIATLKSEAEFNSIKTALGLMATVAVLGYLVSLRIPAKKLA